MPDKPARGRAGEVRVTAARRYGTSAKVECVYENTTGSFQPRILVVLDAFDESGRFVGADSKTLADIPSGSGAAIYLSTTSVEVSTHFRVCVVALP